MVKKTISLAEARKILGAKSSYMTDKQLEHVLNALYALCDRVVYNLEKKP